MNTGKRTAIYSKLRELDPNPDTELHYDNPFELLVAVVLSAQATDISVNKATAKLYRVANTPWQMLDLGEAGLREYIKTIGLFNSKAKNVIATSKILLEQSDSQVPDDRAALEALPGVEAVAAVAHRRAPEGELAIVLERDDSGARPRVDDWLTEHGMTTLPLREVDEIPTSGRHAGKIDRQALRRQLEKCGRNR